LVVRVNYDKCTVLLRNQRLISLAAHDIGETTSQVYAGLLRLLEEKIPRCQRDLIPDGADDEGEPTVTTMELCRALNNSIDPAIGIGKVSSDKVDTSSLERPRRKQIGALESTVESQASSDEDDTEDENGMGNVAKTRSMGGVDQDSSDHGEGMLDNALAVKEPARHTRVTFEDISTKSDSQGDRQSKMVYIKKHLLLLMEHSCHFVRLCGGRGLGEWTVDFSGLVEYLKETEIDTVISQRFGIIGKRIAQILRHKGKLDEKQIQKFGLLKQKDVRTKLVEMQMVGFVDIQEVPKDNNRTPSRTMFLWFLDINRVMAIIQDSIYKAMSRCLQVLDVERVGVAAILERTDIKGREEELLDKNEFTEFRVIKEKEEKILAQVSRLDDLMAIFQDF
jgi:DNA-directed RNA polymerase III subunit RPC3